MSAIKYYPWATGVLLLVSAWPWLAFLHSCARIAPPIPPRPVAAITVADLGGFKTATGTLTLQPIAFDPPFVDTTWEPFEPRIVHIDIPVARPKPWEARPTNTNL